MLLQKFCRLSLGKVIALRLYSSSPFRKAVELDLKVTKNLNELSDSSHHIYSLGSQLSIEEAEKKHDTIICIPQAGEKSIFDVMMEQISSQNERIFSLECKVDEIYSILQKSEGLLIAKQFLNEIDHRIIVKYFGHTKLFLENYPSFCHFGQVVKKYNMITDKRHLNEDEVEFIEAGKPLIEEFGKDVLNEDIWLNLTAQRNEIAYPSIIPRAKVLIALENLKPHLYGSIISALQKFAKTF